MPKPDRKYEDDLVDEWEDALADVDHYLGDASRPPSYDKAKLIKAMKRALIATASLDLFNRLMDKEARGG